MIIRSEHINEAERLLINGNRFDTEERVPFIQNLNSCDLLAVPGSGKTTALLAKLYCLSKYLPFNDGSGILVISHTNAAVHEIENNLRRHCPNLFTYPNFIGTIQSFVNRFLANQICMDRFGSYININDNDIYEREVMRFYYSLRWSKKGADPKNLVNKLFGLVNAGQQVDFDTGCLKIIDFLKNFQFNITDRKIIYNNKTILKYDSVNSNYYLQVESWKLKLLSKGLLNFNDSYTLGNLYLDSHPEIIKILRERFKFVLIDEMQDLEKFQLEIIDKIFYGENSPSVIQRIGDLNQSIYSSGKRVRDESDWIPRNPLFLKGSNRLTSEIASIVNFFTLDRQTADDGNPRFIVNGLRQLDNPIKPHILLFDHDSIIKLESKFRELIMNLSLQDTKEGAKYGFKIIGWNAKWDGEEMPPNKLRLENIFKSYSKERKSNKETYDSLSKYLQLFDHEKNTLEAARKAVLNALIHILRLENKSIIVKIRGNEISRYYTKDELIKFIKNPENNCDYELFKKIIYAFAFKLAIRREHEKVYRFFKKFISSKFKVWFSLEINPETVSFIGDSFVQLASQKDELNSEEQTEPDIKIDIATVHSAKGQTHCATMYVETSYHDYETNKLKVISRKATASRPEEYLPNPLFGQEHSYRQGKDIRAKETLKMMYVGFSRPTHLLCFACLKENVSNIEGYINAGWEVIDLTV